MELEQEETEESHFRRKQPKGSVAIRMNTKDCCFLCLRTINNGKSSLGNLQSLCQFLNIGNKDSVESNANNSLPNCTISPSSGSKVNCGKFIKATLCDSCNVLNDEFTNFHQILHKTQMMVDYTVDKINNKVAEAYRNPKLVQHYSQKMTSDKESLAQLAFVDKIRKQIAQKSSTARLSPQLKLKVSKLDVDQFEREKRKLKKYQRSLQIKIKQESSESYLEDIPDNSLPPSPTAPSPSPEP